MPKTNAHSEAGSPTTSTPDYVELYRIMLLARVIDDEEIRLKKSSRAYFNISGAGHEAVGVAVGQFLRPAHDWTFPYYRDRTVCLQLGMTPYEMLLSSVGSPEDPNSGGRQMTSHWGHKRLRIVSQSSPTGTQFNQAVGCAEAGRYIAGRGLDLAQTPGEIVYVSSGEGATSEGEFWEAINVASNQKLPVLFVVQDNEYALSVPVEVTVAGGSVSHCFESVPGLRVIRCDGNKLNELIPSAAEAVEHVRKGLGPVLYHVKVTRPYSHSLSDDQHAYRTDEELADEASKDCLRFQAEWLVAQGLATVESLAELKARCQEEVKEASRQALAARQPKASEVMDHMYSPDRPEFVEVPVRTRPDLETLTMAQAINRALAQELERDDRVVIFGEDVADATRPDAMRSCKGKGGVFKITHGLQSRFGSDRVFNTMLSENSIIGRAVGMAVRGLKPVAEIQFLDFLWYGFMHVRGEMATMRFRSAGQYSAPVVLRVPAGGYLRGGGIYHSQSAEATFVNAPGLLIAYPSNAADAMGLLKAAIRMDDPVIFLEHKHLYYQTYNRTPDPGPDHVVPFGKAAVRRAGTEATIVTWGALVQKSLEAADRLKRRRGFETEVIDLRTIRPLDIETIYASVRKTGRLLVVHEEMRTGGFGAEIAALVAGECFEWLDAPIKRVASKDVWVAYSPVLEAAALPQTEDVEKALEELIIY